MNGLIWIDTETTGLDAERDHLLEVAVVITDGNGDVKETFQRLILPMFPTLMEEYIETLAAAPPGTGPNIVWQMHYLSGLWNEVLKSGLKLDRVDTELSQWLQQHQTEYDLKFGKMPMCGNSVWFDHSVIRNKLPLTNKLFGHRNIDVSSIKELTKVRETQVADAWEAETADSTKPHRAMEDILHSIREYQFYLHKGFIA